MSYVDLSLFIASYLAFCASLSDSSSDFCVDSFSSSFDSLANCFYSLELDCLAIEFFVLDSLSSP